MPRGRKETVIYSVYSSDEFAVVGTASECAKYLDIKVDTFYTYIGRRTKNLDIVEVDQDKTEKGGIGLTLSEYMRENDHSIGSIAKLASVDWRVAKRAVEKEKTSSKRMLTWCESVGITFQKATRTKPPKDTRWRKKADEEQSYLPVVLASIRKGAKEIRVFNDDNLKVLVDHFKGKGIKYEVVPFNAECVHVRITR